jgi:hypothetical protein
VRRGDDNQYEVEERGLIAVVDAEVEVKVEEVLNKVFWYLVALTAGLFV